MNKIHIGYYDKDKKDIIVDKEIGIGKSEGYKVVNTISKARKLKKVLVLLSINENGKLERIILPVKGRMKGLVTGSKSRVLKLSHKTALKILPYLKTKESHHVARWAWIRYDLSKARKINAKDPLILNTLKRLETAQVK